MRTTGRRSGNIEDRRGMRIPGGGLAVGGAGTIILILLATLFGFDPSVFLGGGSEPTAVNTEIGESAEEKELVDFVRVVLGDTEDTWQRLFAEQGKTYSEPKLVLFRDQVRSACGMAGAATGPFYCPADHSVYLDLSFFDELRQRFGAPGDFAQAYVIAHEIGHHVQNLLGTMDRVNAMRGRVSEEEYNQLSVRLELQADFLAGCWAHHAHKARRILEAGDVEEALQAAAAIGDDRLQRRARGYVTPDSFTHGTSAQRARWFRLGLETGDPSRGDTFSAKRL